MMGLESKKTASQRPSETTLLSKAVIRAAKRLDIKRSELAKILWLSRSEVSRLKNGSYELDSGENEWGLAIFFVQMYRSLDSRAGNDETARRWLRSENIGLGGVPLTLLHSPEGIVQVCLYLDTTSGLS